MESLALISDKLMLIKTVCFTQFARNCLLTIWLSISGNLFSQTAPVATSETASLQVNCAVEALGKNTTNGVPLLLEQLAKSDLALAAQNQLFAAFFTRISLNKPAEPGLRRLLTNSSVVVQGHAAIFLQCVNPLNVETVNILREHLRTGGVDLRRAAAMALGNATNSVLHVGPDLLMALYRDERLVAQGAAFGLARLGDAAAPCWPTIAAMFAHQEVDVKIRACWAMQHGALPAEIAVPSLQAEISSPLQSLRYECLGALRAYGLKSQPTAAVVAMLLHDSDQSIRLEAIQTLRRIGATPAHVLPDLVESIERGPNSDGYLYAAGGLLNAYGKAALPALARLQACYTNRLRVELGRLGGLNAAAATEWELALKNIQNSLPANRSSPAAQPRTGPMAEEANDRNEPAIETLERDAKAGSVEAQYQLGRALFMGQRFFRDRPAGIQWLSRAGKAGYAPALSILGRIYAGGNGVARDYSKSRELLTEAAEKNDATAQLVLGSIYFVGVGVAQDYSLALSWFHKSALHGDKNGQTMMGIVHLNGLGVKRDIDEATKWFGRAADQEFKDAQYFLGQIHHTGLNGTRDEAEAIKWYLKAAQQGHHVAEYYVAAAYLTGVGPEVKDQTDKHQLQVLGLPWLRKAAEGGVGDAQSDLGRIELESEHYSSSLFWLTRAVVLGNPRATHNLALMFGSGTGVPKDSIESYKWHFASARIGHQDSKGLVRQMEAILDQPQVEAGRQRAEMIRFEKINLLLKPDDIARRLLLP